MPQTESVKIASVPSTFGETTGALALPAGDGKAPAVVVLQEYWGVNDHIKAVVQRWAAAGFVALAPDLYRGTVTTSADEAMSLLTSLDGSRAIADIAGAVELLRAHPRVSGKVGVTGYCMGGAYALASSTVIRDLGAVVPFYGLPPAADWSKVTAPIQAHFASTDDWAKPELARKIQETIQAQGGSMELFVYEAQHAFCNDTRPEVYSPENAKLAWERAVEFMRKHLS